MRDHMQPSVGRCGVNGRPRLKSDPLNSFVFGKYSKMLLSMGGFSWRRGLVPPISSQIKLFDIGFDNRAPVLKISRSAPE